MKRQSILLYLALALFPALAWSADSAGDSVGETLYSTCAACHGASGGGMPALNAPALAGQDADYIARQLQNFRNGLRGAETKDTYGMQMTPMASLLADGPAVAEVSAYIAGMPAAASGEAATGDLRNGENQYNAACGACHGGKAEGNTSLHSPRLAGLDTGYLKRQLKNYASGIRGSHPDDKYGRQMQMMSSMLTSDKDLDDVIGFIHSNAAAQ